MYQLTASPHPFKVSTIKRAVPDGWTLAQMMEYADLDNTVRPYAHVWIGDQYIPRELWHRVRPKPGASVIVKVIAGGGGGGGGKNPLRTILMIAVIAASIYFGGALGTFLVNSVTGSTLVGGTVAIAGVGVSVSSIGAAVIMGVGSLLVNMIAPVRPPKMASLGGTSTTRDSPTLFIEGARNSARPFGTVPSVLGRHRMYPPLGAKYYTEIVGDDNYVRMLVVWGYGPLKIENVKIGETALEDFDNYEVEHREGRADDEPLTLYPDSVTQENFTIALSQAADWQTRTAQPSADELSVDVTFSNGLVAFDANGGRGNTSVAMQIQYRAVGDVDWLTPVYSATTVDSSWVAGDTITFTHNRTSVIRHGFRWPVARGQYEIRIRRTTADTDNTQIFDSFYWSALRTIRDSDPVRFAFPVAKTAIRIKATDQLNSVVDELNAVITSYARSYEDGIWAERETSNPAALFRHVLQGNANAKRRTDDQVNIDALEYWSEQCDALGFEFNMVRDFQASVWDTLADICAAGRASPANVDGKWTVVFDEEQTVPVQHFTPRNSWGFEADKAFPEQPHAFRIRFNNRDADWRQDERIVYTDGYDSSNAEIFESAEAPGVTDPDAIWKFGRFSLAQAQLRPERWGLYADFEYIVSRRGDLVTITHDVIQVGLKSGRIKALTRRQAFDYDFSTGTLPSGVTITSDGNGTRINSSGALVTPAANAARFTYNKSTLALRGLLNEPGKTQSVSRSTLAGTTGASGTLTSGAIQPASCTYDVLGFGTVDGLPYMDITLTNASGSTQYPKILFQNPAVANQGEGVAHTVSASLQRLGGSNPTYVGLGANWANSGGSYTGEAGNAVVPTTTLTRYDSEITPPSGSPKWNPYLNFIMLNGQSVTLRIALPQGEQGSDATSEILTTGSVVSRAADVVALACDPGVWDISIIRESGVTTLTDVVVAGSSYVVPTSASPLLGVEMTNTELGPVVSITSDEVLTMEGGESYGVSIRTIDDAKLVKQVVTSAGDQTTLTFTSPIPAANSPVVGDLFSFGILGQVTVDGIVLSIEPSSDISAKLMLMPASPAVYSSDQGTIPPYESGLTPIATVPEAVIDAIRSDESVLVLGSGNTLSPSISVTVRNVERNDLTLDVQIRASGTNEPFYNAEYARAQGGDYRLRNVEQGRRYDVRVRWRAADRLPGAWTPVYNHLVVGLSTPPEPLANASISVYGGQALIRWTRPNELDVRMGGVVLFRHSPEEDSANASWAASTSIGTAAKGDALFTTLPLKPGTYLARVYDKQGIPSEVVALATKQASVLAYANLSTVTESPTFAGTRDGVTEGGGNLYLTSLALFDDITDLDATGIIDYLGGVRSSGTYTFGGGVDLGSIKRVRVTSQISATSVNTLDQIDERIGNVDSWENWDGTEQSAADARVQVRWSDDNPAGSPVTWSAWNDLDSAEFEARAFEFRCILTTSDPAFNILVDTLAVVIEEI